MVRIRYTRWDGSQSVHLDPARVFEKLADVLSYTDDVRQAMDWLLRQGATWEDQRIVGLDELLERLREEMRERYREFNLDRVFDETRRELDEIVARESGSGTDATKLDDLPFRASDAIERLKRETLHSPEARRRADALSRELEDVRDLEEFVRRYGDLFQGPDSLGFEDAVRLMREIERLKGLEEALFSGKLGEVNLDDLREFLGDEAWGDVQVLHRMVEAITEGGYVLDEEGRFRLSPRGVRKIGELALRDIYESLVSERSGRHDADARGAAEIRPDERRAYEFGDPFYLDLVETLKRSVARAPRTPIGIEPSDLIVQEADVSTTTSTVLLLDMSWSMSWEGRFAAAKKVALALESLVRSRYPRDYLGIVGFYTRAVELNVRDLPEASWNMGDPFTNLQDGLRLATDLLRRHPSRNQHVIVITDGQPTAYFSGGRLYCEWPLSFGGISMRAAAETLKEVERVTRRGVTINTFMLDDSPALRAFVERMTKINRGRALFTRPDQLGQYLLVDYLAGRRRRI